MAEWIMVAISFMYVAATILICISNFGSSKASKRQAAELKRQFEETNRAFVTVSLETVTGGLIAVCVKNHGRLIANEVKVRFQEEFLDKITSTDEKERLNKLNNSSFSIGIGQSWYASLGNLEDMPEILGEPIHVSISYNDKLNEYTDNFDIDTDKHFWSLNYSSPLEEISGEIKETTMALKGIEKDLANIAKRMNDK